MSRWDGLSPRERAELMALFAREGVTDVRRMRTIYDEGGDIKPAVVNADYPRMKETLDLVNSSDANFVSRLKDANRRTIPDWEVKGNVATHKLGWTTMDGKAYVYPLVQEIDGELYDFTDPKYGFDDYDKAAIDHALSTGDYVAMPKESDARWFTESYKNHYPTFNEYRYGGDKDNDVDAISGADIPAVDTDPQKSKTAWFDWWYKFRDDQIDADRKNAGEIFMSKEKYKKKFTDYVHERINKVGESYNDIYGKINAPEFISPASEDSVAREQILDFGSDIGRNDYESSAKSVDFMVEGFYTPYFNHIIYNPDDGKLPDDTMIHERTHVLRDTPYYYTVVKENRKLAKDGVCKLANGVEHDSYYDSMKEIYARLNSFRYANGLNPSHIYSKEEISRFRRDGLLRKYHLDRYTDDYIYFLLNGLADSGEGVGNKSGINSAAFGGLLNKYSGGGDKSGDSEVMVRLGEDDYLHQGELDPAVVVAESKKPMTYIPREMFNIVKDKPASEEEMALRKVVDSLVRKDKPTPLTILDSYRSAYRNPFIVNPFAYNIPIVNRFGLGGDEQSVDEEIYDVLPQASRVVLGNQSRRGLKRAAFKAVFDGNPYNPDEKDTFLEDYLADNNIVQFENDKRKRIFDRAIRRNMRDKEDLTSENGFGIYPTKYNGYSKVVMPDGQTTFIRSEKPMERDDILEWIPMVGDAHDVQDAWQDINDGDYMSAGVILALSALPGPVGQKVKPWMKRMSGKYKRYIEKRIKDGNVLSTFLHTEKAKKLRRITDTASSLSKNMKAPVYDLRKVGWGRYVRAQRKKLSKQSDKVLLADLGYEKAGSAGKKTLGYDGYGSADISMYNNAVNSYGLLSSKSGSFSIDKKIIGSDKIAANNIYYRIDNNTISPNIAKENNRVNNILNGNGVVSGSATMYEVIPGMPNDVDIITTPSKVGSVIKSLDLKDSGAKNGVGDTKYVLKKKIYGKDSVDLDIIHESNGHAEGVLAENIFAYVDPKGYKAWRDNNLKLRYDGQSQKPIPYGADELYDMLTSDSNGVFGFNLLNTVKSGRMKDNDRITAIIATNPKLVRDSIIRNGESVFGDSFMSAQKLYPNMVFNNIEDNKIFLKEIGLPVDWADDPEKIMAVVEKYSFEKTTATRGIATPPDSFNKFIEYSTSPTAKHNMSGPGRNSVEGSNTGGGRDYTGGGLSAIQFPISFNSESFRSPLDLVKAVDKQVKSGKKLRELFNGEQLNFIKNEFSLSPDSTMESLFSRINDAQSSAVFRRGLEYSASENDRIAKALDLPVVRNKDSYFYNDGKVQRMSGYVGGLTNDYYGLGYTDYGRKIELGSLIPDGISGYQNVVKDVTPNHFVFNKMDRLYNKLRKAANDYDNKVDDVSDLFRGDKPTMDDLLSHARNYKETRRFLGRQDEVNLMSDELKAKYKDINRKIGNALDKSDRIKNDIQIGSLATLGIGSIGALGVGMIGMDRDVKDIEISNNQDINDELDNNQTLRDYYNNGNIKDIVDYIDKKFNKDKQYTRSQIRRRVKSVLKEKDEKDNEK